MEYAINMERNEIKASFNIRGFDCEPTDITKKLGIKPDNAGIEGDPHPVGAGRTVPLRGSLWSLKSVLDVHRSVEDHIEALLEVLEAHSEPLKELARKYESKLFVAIYYYEVNPSILLSNSVLRRIADLNIALDFDIYCLADNEE